jgi:hypothetical protein
MHHLIDTGRAPLTTVVFDREAILTKNIHADLYKDIPALAIGPVRWLPSRGAARTTTSAPCAKSSKRFSR